MANTFELIASSTVGAGGAASIDFSSIPSTYTDLVVVLSSRCTQSGNSAWSHIYFNGSNTNLSSRALYGSGSATGNASSAVAPVYSSFTNAAGDTANTFNNETHYIPNYAGSNYKSFNSDSVTENNATLAVAAIGNGLWSSTAAINQVTIYPDSGNYVQYSTAYLYGVKNA